MQVVRSWRTTPVVGVALLGALLILIPLVATAWISMTSGVPGASQYTSANYLKVLSDPFGYRVLWNTLLFSLGSTAIAMALAVPLAWAVARTDLPFKSFISLTMGIILVIPGFIQGIGWGIMLSPSIGVVNRIAMQALNTREAPFNIYSLPGMILVEGLELVPPAFFILLAALLSIDGTFDEAAFMSGASKVRTFLRVDMPLVLPAILAASIYLLVLSATLFEIPAVLGFPERIFVLSTMIYLLVGTQIDLPAYGTAAAYGTVIMVMSVALTMQYSRILRSGRKYATIGGKGRRVNLLRLGKWRPVAAGLVGLYFLLAIGLPLITLVYYSLIPFFRMPSLEALNSITLRNYVTLVDLLGPAPFVNTALLSVTVPLLVLALSVPISWVVVRSKVRGRALLDNVAFLPVAIPRIVIAVAILYLGLLARGWLPIYGTIWIIAAAHVVMFVSFATRTLNGAMIQIHPELEESARMSGASQTRVLARVTLPLLRPALFFAWFWVLLLAFREVTVAIMLSSPDNVVLPAVIWFRWNGSRPHEAAAAAVVFALIAIVLLLFQRKRLEQATSAGGV